MCCYSSFFYHNIEKGRVNHSLLKPNMIMGRYLAYPVKRITTVASINVVATGISDPVIT